jgi:hypothetical protein
MGAEAAGDIANNISTEAMPSPVQSFAGMSFNDDCNGNRCGAGQPPDVNGDVGMNHYIEAVNYGVAIYNKSGTRLAAFTENSLWRNAADGNTLRCPGSWRPGRCLRSICRSMDHQPLCFWVRFYRLSVRSFLRVFSRFENE